MLLRRMFPRSAPAHAGEWDKSANGQPRGARQDARHRRIRQYRLAALNSRRGHGHAGHLLRSDRQAAPRQHGACRQPACSAAQSDVVSLHVPETPATHGMIGAAEIARHEAGRLSDQQQPRHGGRSRGAGRRRLRSGHLRGAAVDVFPVEPASNKERFSQPAAGPRERDPDTAYRRLDRGGAGAHRQRGRARSSSIIPMPARPSARSISLRCSCRPPDRHPLYPCPPQRAGHARRLNEVFSQRGLNITGQYLQTDGEIGYVVIEAEGLPEQSRDTLRRNPRARRHDPRPAALCASIGLTNGRLSPCTRTAWFSA